MDMTQKHRVNMCVCVFGRQDANTIISVWHILKPHIIWSLRYKASLVVDNNGP